MVILNSNVEMSCCGHKPHTRLTAGTADVNCQRLAATFCPQILRWFFSVAATTSILTPGLRHGKNTEERPEVYGRFISRSRRHRDSTKEQQQQQFGHREIPATRQKTTAGCQQAARWSRPPSPVVRNDSAEGGRKFYLLTAEIKSDHDWIFLLRKVLEFSEILWRVFSFSV